MSDHAFYPRDPSASSTSKVVDITTLLLFCAEDRTEPFGKDNQQYDLKALAWFLSVSGSGVGNEELA